MHILAIETTGAHASVSLIDEYGKVAELSSGGTLNHLQQLIPMVESLLERENVKKSELTAVAASQGPGSFTGIRIGVSTARALSQALEIPAIPVPTLKAFAYNAEACSGIICPVFDARRSQVYAGAYMWHGGEILELVRGGAYDLAEYLTELARAVKWLISGGLSPCGLAACAVPERIPELTFYGDGVPVYGDKIKEWQASSPICDAEKASESGGRTEADLKCLAESLRGSGGTGCAGGVLGSLRIKFAEGEMALQRASSVAKLALDIYKAGGQVEYESLLPEYMRKSEAERKLENGTLGKKKAN